MPKVSVLVPNYNHSRFLAKRLDSILNQTYQDFELIILDDCSPDNSKLVIERYARHPKVTQIIYNQTNSGSTFAQWNKAIAIAAGELIWIAESDDTAAPDLLETLVKAFDKSDTLALAYCQSNRMDDQDRITGTWLDWTGSMDTQHQFKHDFSMTGQHYIEKFLIYKNTIPNASAVLFKKAAYLAVGGAVPALKTTGDWEIWLKILTMGDVYFSAQPRNNFRYHQNSVIARFRHGSGINDSRAQVIGMYISYIDFLRSYQISSLLPVTLQQKHRYLRSQVMYKIRKHQFKGLDADIRLAMAEKNWLDNLAYLSKIGLQFVYFSSFKLLVDKLTGK